MTDETETGLIRRCQAGEKEAFEPLVRKYAGRATGAAELLAYGTAVEVEPADESHG